MGLASMTTLDGTPVQWPRVSRMSTSDAIQLQKMYESFCPALQTFPCLSGNQNFLINRACDNIIDCDDRSDEDRAVCDPVDVQHCAPSEIYVSYGVK